jgi:hypothetical protein
MGADVNLCLIMSPLPVRARSLKIYIYSFALLSFTPCSLVLSATSQQYLSEQTSYQQPDNNIFQQYFSLGTNQQQSPAKRTRR